MMTNISKKIFILSIIKNFLQQKSILLVDDEEEIKLLMSNYLIKSEIDEEKIIFASNGVEALTSVTTGNVGLIIVDIRMPRMNGLQFMKELKLKRKYCNIPAIIISGAIDAEHVKFAALMGINNIIVKPFTYDIFMEKISRTLGA